MKASRLSLLPLLLGFSILHAQSETNDGSWRVASDDRGYFAIFQADPKVKVRMESGMGGPRLISWGPSPKSQEAWLFLYEYGPVGTRDLYQIQQAVVFRKKDHKILGSFVYKRLPASTGAPAPEQPEWEWTTHSVFARDPMSLKELSASW